MYIAAVLDKEGYDVEILNTLITGSQVRRNRDGLIQCGMSWENIKEEVKRRKPNIVGISNPFIAQLCNANKVSEIVKELDPRIPVIIGGPHASVRPVQLLKDVRSYDIAVIGEGEYTMLDLVKYYKGEKDLAEIDGIAYRKDSDIILNPKRRFIKNLDEIPFPAYHLINMEEHINKYRVSSPQRRKIPMITSRGCPFNCIFCAIHLHMGKLWRAHSKEYVIEHINYVLTKYNVKHIHFEDDNFTLDMRRFEGILDGLIDKGIEFSWDTPNGIRADRFTLDILKKVKKAGCTSLVISAESGDQYTLDNIIDKHLHLDEVIKMAKMCKELNIKLSSYFVIGLPGEKKENMEKTIEFAATLKKRYGVNMAIQVATPFYGTRLWEICNERGYLTLELTPRAFSESPQLYGHGLISTEDFTPEDIKKLALHAQKIQCRLLFLDFLKNPIIAIKGLLRNPKEGLQILRRLL